MTFDTFDLKNQVIHRRLLSKYVWKITGVYLMVYTYLNLSVII